MKNVLCKDEVNYEYFLNLNIIFIKYIFIFKKWLKEICSLREWSYNKFFLVWRELIDRGGKGVFIGGVNEF